MSPLKKYGFAWVTLGFLAISIIEHWVFGWFAYVVDQQGIGPSVEVSGYLVEMLRDTFENWQSEFVQPLWQVVGLTVLLYVGSPQFKQSKDRSEEKLDAILRAVDTNADATLRDMEARHPPK